MSPEPVTMYLSSVEMSQLRTDEDSLDWRDEEKKRRLDSGGSSFQNKTGQVAKWVLSETTVLPVPDGAFGSAYLEYAGAVRSPPSVQKVVLPSADEPFTCKRDPVTLRSYLG